MQNSPKFNEAVEDFINLAERMQNESTELEMFKAEISKAANDAEAQQIMLNAYFEKSFIRECLNFVLMMSNDPKDIGYLRLLISTLHAAISAQYNQRKKKEALAIIYIVANVTN